MEFETWRHPQNLVTEDTDSAQVVSALSNPDTYGQEDAPRSPPTSTSGWGDDWVVSSDAASEGSRLAMVWTLADGTRMWAEARADCSGDALLAVTPPTASGELGWQVAPTQSKRMKVTGNPLIRRAEGTWCVLQDPFQTCP